MKSEVLIFLVTIFGLLFSNQIIKIHKTAEMNTNVLFLSYYEEIEIKVLKDYKTPKKQFRYLQVHPCECPRFNSINKTLDIDGVFKLTDSSKIVFCGGCETNDISLPFKYSFIQLKSLINDSIIEFNLKNKVQLLNPNKEFTDTIVSVEKEGKRIIQRITTIHVKNYGLIDKKNIFDTEGQLKRKLEEEGIRDSLELESIEQY